MRLKGFNEEAVMSSGYFKRKDNYCNSYSFIRKINKNDFPRFHIVKHEAGHYEIHCDLKRLHGRIFSKEINIATRGEELNKETIRISIYKHIIKIENHKREIIRLREMLN